VGGPAEGGARVPVVLAVPLPGTCRVRNSPADRVPSHGTDAFGSSHAVDLVPVDDRGRSAPWSWRALVSTERPDGFVGFGRDVLAPCDGTVVQVHDGEPDHEARRSQPALLGYALTQRERVRRGPAGIAGNHVVVALGDGGPFVLLAHLRRRSVRVAPGDRVGVGQVLGRCGNSGNSTEPHVHLQVSDSTDWPRARGVPFVLARTDGSTWLPSGRDLVLGWASR
jgi:murein DD-endopeptidase MepM/ murein hydrolase activator NlpD